MDISLRSATLVARLNLARTAVAIFSVSVGFVVLFGWYVGAVILTTLLPGLASMKPNTALGLALCGISLWLMNAAAPATPKAKLTRTFGRCFAFLVLALGLATLGEYFFHWNLGIDQLLFADRLGDGHSIPGRMAPHTAICFAVLGLALALIPVATRRGKRPAQFLCLFPILISLMACLGYLYSAISFYKIASYTGMAVHTALTVLLLSLGVFFSPADRGLAAIFSRDTLGGIVLRRILPAAVVVPIVIGWFRMEGQKAGWYGTEFGLALMITINVIVFSFVIYLCAIRIDQIALERDDSEHALQESRSGLLTMNYTFESVIDACPLPVVTLDRQSKVHVWNHAAESLFGWSPLEVRGRPISLAPEDRCEEFQSIIEILQQGESVCGIQTVMLTRGDTKVTVTLWAAPVIEGSRGFSGCVLIMEDAALRNSSRVASGNGSRAETPA
jgi:PAS domain S-box-containing protein